MKYRGTDRQLKNALGEIAKRGGQKGAVAEAALERIEKLERQYKAACSVADLSKQQLHDHLDA